MNNNFEICHECGSKMIRDVRPDEVSYKGLSVTINQPGYYCTKCEEVILTGKDARASEAAWLKLKAKSEGLLEPEEVRKIRKKLRLSQEEAGKILGGGPRAFYKYENGLTLLSKSMNNQLILLSNHPDILNDLITN